MRAAAVGARTTALRRHGQRWTARPALSAAAIYGLLALVLVAPGLLPGRTLSGSDLLWSATPWSASAPRGVPVLGSNFELMDSARVFVPFLQYTRRVLPHIPLWNPYIMSGRPFLADEQSAVFSPFNLPGYLLPFWKSLALIAALKLFVAAFGTYLLGRALGMRFGGALLAGVVFGFGLFMVTWVNAPASSVWATLPWLLLLTEALVSRPGLLPATGLATVVGLQYLGGHPESSFHALFATAAFFLLRLWQMQRAGRRLGGVVLAFVLALMAGTALAALTLLPFLQLLSHSVDAQIRAQRPHVHVALQYLLGILLPDYWGRPTRGTDFQRLFTSFFADRALYAGALTLMVAAAPLILRPRLERVAVGLFGALSLFVVMGFQPAFGIANRLPIFATADNARMIFLFLLCIALLAGWGLDELVTGEFGRRQRRVLLVFGATLLCFPVVWMVLNGQLKLGHLGDALTLAWGFAVPGAALPPHPFVEEIERMGALLEWLVLAGAGLALLTLRLRRAIPGRAFVVLAVVLVAADLFKAGMGYNPAIPIAHAVQPVTGAIRYLQSRRPNRFVGLSSANFISSAPFPPNLAMRYGLYDARGYDFPLADRYARFWANNVESLFATSPLVPDLTPAVIHALRLLSVTDVLQDPRDAPLHRARMPLAYQGPDARVYAIGGALPRTFVVDHQQVIPGARDQLAAVSALQFNARQVAITEHVIPGLPKGGAEASRSPGSARLAYYAAERIVADTDVSRRSLLVLTDTYFPGWTASVDGKAAQVDRVDYVLRGVAVPPGRHRVEFRFEPATFSAGRIISGVTLLGLVVLAAIGWRRQRTTPSTSHAARRDGEPRAIAEVDR